MIRRDRIAAMRFVAEAHAAMDDDASALAAYIEALEEGAANPNQRPRAMYLAATAVSMALHGVEPDEALWTRLREIREGLDQP